MKGVFNIMKTNKSTRIIIAIMAVVILSSLTVSVFAETGTDVSSEAYAFKRGQKENKGQTKKHDDDWFEDWFEKRIEDRENEVDFSQLPENPTEEDMIEFFKKNFIGENAGKTGNGKSDESAKKDHKSNKRDQASANAETEEGKSSRRPMKHNHDKADRYEDWFEDRIDACKHHVDFSELPENPTDEEIVEFFRKNFMNEDKEAAPADAQSDIESAAETQTEIESTAEPQAEEEPVKDPAEVQSTEETASDPA